MGPPPVGSDKDKRKVYRKRHGIKTWQDDYEKLGIEDELTESLVPVERRPHATKVAISPTEIPPALINAKKHVLVDALVSYTV